jgi:hypothetical protein
MKQTNPAFPRLCVARGLPEPVPEFRFHPVRKWRLDYAWPDKLVALEVEGAIWMNGGHSRGSGKVKDHDKFSTAAGLGWRFVFCQPRELLTSVAIERVRAALLFHFPETEKRAKQANRT